MHEFLRNVWYMAAWAEEVGEGLLSRRIAGRKLVLFRAADGTPVALEDRCPHRFAPLSLGLRSERPLSLGVDQGGLRARRLIQDLLRREQKDRPVGGR